MERENIPAAVIALNEIFLLVGLNAESYDCIVVYDRANLDNVDQLENLGWDEPGVTLVVLVSERSPIPDDRHVFAHSSLETEGTTAIL